jgi:hypothetical protein
VLGPQIDEGQDVDAGDLLDVTLSPSATACTSAAVDRSVRKKIASRKLRNGLTAAPSG